MPQLAKGGKWVFGWTEVGGRRQIIIPREAYLEYGFQPGEKVWFLAGSRSSGGFGVFREARKSQTAIPLERRAVAEGIVGQDERLALPPETGVKPGEKLLVVRGSGRALGFLRRGPIVIEARRHPGLETFSVERPRKTGGQAGRRLG